MSGVFIRAEQVVILIGGSVYQLRHPTEQTFKPGQVHLTTILATMTEHYASPHAFSLKGCELAASCQVARKGRINRHAIAAEDATLCVTLLLPAFIAFCDVDITLGKLILVNTGRGLHAHVIAMEGMYAGFTGASLAAHIGKIVRINGASTCNQPLSRSLDKRHNNASEFHRLRDRRDLHWFA